MRIFIISIILFLTTTMALGQQPGGYEDSVLYVEPQTIEADLSMYTPPSTFEVSPAFNGYIDKKHGAGITMMFITNLHFSRLVESMNEEFYEQNQLKYISEQDFESSHGYKGRIYKFKFYHNNSNFIRYMVYAGDSDGTLWLNITFNELVEEILELDIIDSLQSINVNVEENEGN